MVMQNINPIRYSNPSGHAVTDWDKKNLSKSDQAKIKKATDDWNTASKAGDKAGMAKAHADAERVRKEKRKGNEVGTSNGNTVTKRTGKDKNSDLASAGKNLVSGLADKAVAGLINGTIKATKLVAKGGGPFGLDFAIRGEAKKLAGFAVRSTLGKFALRTVGLATIGLAVVDVQNDLSKYQGQEALGRVVFDITKVGAAVGIAVALTPAGWGVTGAVVVGAAVGTFVDLGADKIKDIIW